MLVRFVIIAEKESVATELAKTYGLSLFKKKEFCYTGSSGVIYWLNGHIMRLKNPEEYDEKQKDWSWENLPLKPNPFEYTYKNNRAKKIVSSIITDLSDSSELINACDAGREGELIFKTIIDEIRKQVAIEVPLKRMYILDNTEEGLKQAIDDVLPQSENNEVMQNIGFLRSKADWLLGMNGTRAVSLAMSSGGVLDVWSVGRVQTALLGLLYQRHKSIINFKSTPYYKITLNFKYIEKGVGGKHCYEAKVKVPEGAEKHGKFTALFENKREVKLIELMIKRSKLIAWTCKDAITNKSINPRKPFNLCSLQQCMSTELAWSPTKTLEQLQQAYLEGYVSYPRTESSFIPPKVFEKLSKQILDKWDIFGLDRLESINKEDYEDLTKCIMYKKIAKKIGEHYALIPTKFPDSEEEWELLKQKEWFPIYKMIITRIICALSKPITIKVMMRSHEIPIIMNRDGLNMESGEVLNVRAESLWNKIEDKGWYSIAEHFGIDLIKQELPNDELPDIIDTEEKKKLVDIDLGGEMTSPPDNYNEGELMADMQRFSLGTAATRAEILDILLRREYIKRKKKVGSTVLMVQYNGRKLIEFLVGNGMEGLATPVKTSKWEKGFKELEEMKPSLFDITEFEQELNAQVDDLVNFSKKSMERIEIQELVCPRSGKPVVETEKGFEFDGYPGLLCPKKMAGTRISARQYCEILLKPGGIGPLRFTSKRKRKFKARLVYAEDKNSIEFNFV